MALDEFDLIGNRKKFKMRDVESFGGSRLNNDLVASQHHFIIANNVAFVVYSEEPKFLISERDTNEEVSERLGRPAKIWAPGTYALFTGGIEKDEMPDDAAIREFKEELNIDLLNPEKYGLVAPNYTGVFVASNYRENTKGILVHEPSAWDYLYEVRVRNLGLFLEHLSVGEGKVKWLSMEEIENIPIIGEGIDHKKERVMNFDHKTVVRHFYKLRLGNGKKDLSCKI